MQMLAASGAPDPEAFLLPFIEREHENSSNWHSDSENEKDGCAF